MAEHTPMRLVVPAATSTPTRRSLHQRLNTVAATVDTRMGMSEDKEGYERSAPHCLIQLC